MRTILRGTGVVCLALLLGCAEPETAEVSYSGPPVEAAGLNVEIAAPVEVASHDATDSVDAIPVAQADAEQSETSSSSETTSSTESQAATESVKTVTFDHIKFEMTKGDKFRKRMLTAKINEMFGKSIRIRGYIRPSFKEKGLTSFILVRDNQECCYGPGAALFDCIAVQMADNKTTSFTIRQVSVEGVFSFEKIDNPDPQHAGQLLSIYRLDAVRVK